MDSALFIPFAQETKLYGVTGWRLGVIAINEDNVFDELIKKLPEKKKKELESDYSIVTLNPSEMGFVERICADSRSIGLYHTSGLSTPQQIDGSFLYDSFGS